MVTAAAVWSFGVVALEVVAELDATASSLMLGRSLDDVVPKVDFFIRRSWLLMQNSRNLCVKFGRGIE